MTIPTSALPAFDLGENRRLVYFMRHGTLLVEVVEPGDLRTWVGRAKCERVAAEHRLGVRLNLSFVENTDEHPPRPNLKA